MPTLVFEKNFLDDFAKLEPPVRQKVRELPDKFAVATHTGIHLEKLNGPKDDRVRTVRVDQFWRGVVVRLGEGKYALLRVMAHDDAIEWAKRQRFGVNPVTGLVEILDIPTVESTLNAVSPPVPEPAGDTLFADVRDRDFQAVGVDAELIPVLRRIQSDAELLAIAHLLPSAQGDAILLLADGRSPEEVWKELAQDYELTGDEVDTEDIDRALERPGSRSSFIVTTNDTELVELLSGDFEAWRTFLHPTQRALAYRPSYSGPAKVTGGAGTGKTIVAIHRARYLARRLAEQGDTTGRILVATFTTTLKQNLERTLRGFCTPEEFRRIEVATVDSLAHQVLAAARGGLHPVRQERLGELADQAATMAGLEEFGLDGRFLLSEWTQVILARGLGSLAEYATGPRPGRGRPLGRSARKAVWQAVEYLTGALSGEGVATFPQLADQAAALLATRETRPFAHVIVDEAQDLHPTQWRLLRVAVDTHENDLFIVGDAHQRIYEHRVSLLSLGIDTRGRSRRLKINYRTSQQILGWALGILTGEQIDDLDGNIERQVGYRSAFSGPRPVVRIFSTPGEEAEAIVEQVQAWLGEGISPHAIGITARTRNDLGPIRDALTAGGIARGELGSDGNRSGVRIGTMHSCKGLEFARLVVAAANADRIPLPKAVTPEADDPVQHQLDIQRERCLLYVACTRARDQLVVTAAGEVTGLVGGS